MFIGRVEQQVFTADDERKEWIRSVRDRLGDLLDSWCRALDEHHGDVYYGLLIDDDRAFIASAHLPEIPLDRNVEIRLLVRERARTGAMTRHFTTLIEQSLLHLLPG